MKKIYTFIDLFAGIGGFRLALESLGMKCMFSSEIDEFCKKVYKDNFKEEPTGDITKVDPKNIPDFDILVGGFPCQPFSYAGRLEGFEDKTRGTLFFDIVKILKEKKPKMFILENVKGLKSHDKGKTLDTIITTLKEIGYNVHWDIVNSYNFGVPQLRERWFCVGFKDDIDFSIPKGNKMGAKLRDIIDINDNNPKLKLTDLELARIEYHFKQLDLGIERVQHDSSMYAPNTKKGKHGVYSYLKPDGCLRFHIGDKAKTQIQEAYYCSLDSLAPTIIASREPRLWDLKRRLSVEECKRLQGFPKGFKMDVSDTRAKHQLGNAITVPVVEEIAKAMIKAYEEYHSREVVYQQIELDLVTELSN